MPAISHEQLANLALGVLTASPAAQSQLAQRYAGLREGAAAYDAAREAVAKVEDADVRSAIWRALLLVPDALRQQAEQLRVDCDAGEQSVARPRQRA